MGRALAILMWIIALVTTLAFATGRWWLPPAVSEYGAAIDPQFLATMLIIGVAFVVVHVALGFTIWRFRAGSAPREASPVSRSPRLDQAITIGTAAVFISLAVVGQRAWAQLHFESAPPDAYRVEIVAQQFQWNFHYAGPDQQFGRTDPALIDDAELNFIGIDRTDPAAADDQVVASALAVPVNRPVELLLRSKDVVHGFWVPSLRLKQDLVPGMTIRLHFTPSRIGKYEIACSQLCGQFHYRMKSYLLVLPDDEHRRLASLDQTQFQKGLADLLARYPVSK